MRHSRDALIINRLPFLQPRNIPPKFRSRQLFAACQNVLDSCPHLLTFSFTNGPPARLIIDAPAKMACPSVVFPRTAPTKKCLFLYTSQDVAVSSRGSWPRSLLLVTPAKVKACHVSFCFDCLGKRMPLTTSDGTSFIDRRRFCRCSGRFCTIGP